MNISNQIAALCDRVPRRHTTDNVKDIYSIIEEYEDILIQIESINAFYEKNISSYFDTASTAKAAIKKSTDNKASKKAKDMFFDEGSGLLKENMQELLVFYGDGKSTK
jgi:hypothetical protein